MTPDAIAAAFLQACHAELQALKPGNVHIHAGGHGMTLADFEASAAAAAPHIAKGGARVGERILRAVEATREKVGQNTNLGIVLLAAPLAASAEHASGLGLRHGLSRVLASLDRQDAELCFRAIALASPGGLGTLPDHDVRGPARIALLHAMRLAAPRDRIARQYVANFADIFDLGIPAHDAADASDAAAKVYWRFLTTFPDSHIARKFGDPKAEMVRQLAQAMDYILRETSGQRDRMRLLLRLDKMLKAEGLNPGTSADLTVATVFARALLASDK